MDPAKVFVIIPPGAHEGFNSLGAQLVARDLSDRGVQASVMNLNEHVIRSLKRRGVADPVVEGLGPLYRFQRDRILDVRQTPGSVDDILRMTDVERLPKVLVAHMLGFFRSKQSQRAEGFALSVTLPTQMIWAIILFRFLRARFGDKRIWIGGSSWEYFVRNSPLAPEILKQLGLEPGESLPSIDQVVRTFSPEGEPRPRRLGLIRGQDMSYILNGGCSYGRCTFCYFPLLNRELTKKEGSLSDLQLLLKEVEPRRLFLADAYIPVDSLLALLESLKDVRGKTEISCFTRFERGLLDREKIAQLESLGLRNLYIGLESAVPRVLTLMKKGITAELASACLKSVASTGIKVHLSAMIGFPGETESEAAETISFISAHRDVLPVRPVIFPFALESGTPVFENFRTYGITRLIEPRNPLYPVWRFECESGMTEQDVLRVFEQASRRLDEIYRSEDVYLMANSVGSQTKVIGRGKLR